MNSEEIRESFRTVNRGDYPELQDYSDEQIWEDNMGPGGLYLAVKMARKMNLKAGDIVMNLGCGKGTTSVFLARHYGVKVFAVDMWISADELHKKFAEKGCADKIIPLNLDITQKLPFAQKYFDAIFCMNSLSFYGGSVDFLNHLFRHLKKDGEYCVGGECLSEEFTTEQLKNPPRVYDFKEGIWEADFLKLHSPPWWEDLFRKSGLVEVYGCEELADSAVLYEDHVLNYTLHKGTPEDSEIETEQIVYGRNNKPYMTLFILAGRCFGKVSAKELAKIRKMPDEMKGK